MPSTLRKRIPHFFRGTIGILCVAVSGFVSSAAVSFTLKRAEELAVRQELERRSLLRHDLLRESLNDHGGALFALRLLIENSTSITAREFDNAATQILARVPGIQAVQWAPLVRHEDLDAFVRRTRSDFDPDFTLRQLDSSGKLAPLSPAPREEYAFITYIYPRTGNEAAIGYDILTAPTAPTLARARLDHLRPALSPSFDLVQGGTGLVLASFADRRSTSLVPPPSGGSGFLQIVLRVDESLSRLWNLTPNSLLDVLIVDHSTPVPTPLFFQLAGKYRPESGPPPSPHDFTTANTFDHNLFIGGRHWRAYYRPGSGDMPAGQSYSAFLTLVGGLVLTALTVIYLIHFRRRHEDIRREVAQRTDELNRSRILLGEIIDHNPSSIWVKDTTLRYRLVNRNFCTVRNLTLEAVIGSDDSSLYSPEDTAEIQATDRRVLASGNPISFESQHTLADGSVHIYLISKFPIRDLDGAVHAVAGIATDITALRSAEAATLHAERRLQESRKLESLGILAGGVAHDFNNLLTGILGHANLTRLILAPSHPAQESLSQIETTVQRAAELCRQMLAYSGRGQLAIKTIDLCALVREAADLVRVNLPSGATLHLDLDTRLPPVAVDVIQLRQIIMNLVLNAAESLSENTGDITLRTRLVVADAALFATCVAQPDLPPGDYDCLEVVDTGQGMPPETLARIFEPFFSTKFTGRGLGLAATLGIVRGHRGALAVSSTPGQGTTFRLLLPAATRTDSRPPAPAVPPPSPKPPAPATGAPLRLLLVDDDAAVRDTAAPLLTAIGYEVVVASDGEEALARFQAAPASFAAAIVDLTMPGLSGTEVLQGLHHTHPGLPVLIISGYSEQGVGLRKIASPRVAFLAKPFTLAQIRAKLDALLASKSAGG